MGLLYLFAEDDQDKLYAKEQDGGLYLTTYGLPPVFWFYLLTSLATLAFLSLAVWSPLRSVLKGDDQIKFFMGICVLILMIGLPIVSFGFFFYRKELLKKGSSLTISHRLFGIKFFQKNHQLKPSEMFKVEHQLESPNLAKLSNDPQMRGFQNKGHFYLYGISQNGNQFMIDRHSRKIDLEKLKAWLEKY